MKVWDVISPIFKVAPVFYHYYMKKCIQKRIDKFKRGNDIDKSIKEELHIVTYIDHDKKYFANETPKIIFYKFHKVILNKNKDFIYNNIVIPIGFHTYKIISQDELRIDILNDKKIERVDIYKKTNIPIVIYGDVIDYRSESHGDIYNGFVAIVDIHNEINQEKVFETIISWKYK